MTQARSETVIEGMAVYHCISRCVRRAYLQGNDIYTGFNYDHRKKWLRERLVFLTTIFTIEALAYALMDNHQHTMLRTRPDKLKELSDMEVAKRWLKLYPRAELKGDKKLTREYLKGQCEDQKRINKLRKRLVSISWFMKSVNEYIARRANREDKCKGRFWEGRFKCMRVEGGGARLSCAMYIDLNPIRAKKAQTPEGSEYTSAWERIEGLKQGGEVEPQLWLTPIRDQGDRAGFLGVTLKEYLEILDSTGRQLKAGKAGRIEPELAPILERIGVKPDGWLELVSTFGKRFSHFAGNESSLLNAATAVGKKWVKGLSLARLAFS